MQTATPDIENEAKEGLGGKKTVSDWLKWIKAAKKAASRHWQDTREAWREFEKDTDDRDSGRSNNRGEAPKVYPAYYAAVETLLPAFYARTPQLVTERAFEIDDDVANTMALINQRVGKYFLRTSGFDETMKSSTADFIHAAKACNQIIYKAEIGKERKELQKVDEQTYVGADGQPYAGEVKQDTETKAYFGESDAADEDSQCIELRPVPSDEIIHSPNAKVFDDIREIGIYFSFTKEEAQERFDAEVLANYPWKKGVDNKGTEPDDLGRERLETSEYYMDGWECCDKDSKTVYWVSESYPTGFLKPPALDPWGFKGFFPITPFIVMNKPRKTLYPRPAYIHLRPTLTQLHVMYQRVFELIDSVRRRAIVDGDDDLVSALNAGDQEYISAKSLKSLIEKGGLESMVHYVPVAELVQAIVELNQQQEIFDSNVAKWIGVPGILRGESDPIEAVGTQEIKATAAHDRFRVYKKDIQQMARDSIEMMLDLAYGTFSDQKIARIAGFDYMKPEDQQRFPEALARLRNDTERVIRIDVETDSMTFIDQGLKAQRRNLAIQTALNGVNTVAQMAQENPVMANLALRTVLLGLEGLDDGKQYQDEIKSIGKQLIEAAQNPPPPPPTPPDYEAQKVEVMAREVAVKERAQTLEERTAPVEDQMKISESMAELELKAKELELKTMIATSKQEVEAMKQELDAIKAVAAQKAEQQWIELEKAKAMHGALATALEAQQVKTQQTLEAMQLMSERVAQVESLSGAESTSPGVSSRAPKANQPAMHIHVGGDADYEISRDASGTLKGKKTMKKSNSSLTE